MSSNNNRIALNTVYLYLRMLFLVIIQLYTVPIILDALGVEDYGIYNVVGGIVGMFTFIGGALSSGSQRFLSYAIGQENQNELKRVFDSTQTIYVVYSLILFFIAESVGIWFLNNKMQIPESRIMAANWVFQFSVISFIINLLAIPYNSAIIAHERMSVFAYVSIIDGVLKLAAAVSLSFLNGDLLIWYAVFICLISILVRLIYQIYCNHSFVECKGFHFTWDNELSKKLLTYSGWNMIGSLALIARNQGLNIVVNIFFGPILNAAHSLAQQIGGLVTQLINNVYLATRPQITKLYAQDNKNAMWNLVFKSSKWTFFLLMIISIPAILEMKNILDIWLPEIPDYTVEIAQLLIISIVIETTVNQIIGAFQAMNHIKKYQMVSSTILLLNIPISYILLKYYKSGVLIPYCVTCLLSFFYMFSLLHVAKSEISMDIKKYIKTIMLKMLLVTASAFSIEFLIYQLLPESLFRIFITVIESIIISCICIWLMGADDDERFMIKQKIKKLFYAG